MSLTDGALCLLTADLDTPVVDEFSWAYRDDRHSVSGSPGARLNWGRALVAAPAPTHPMLPSTMRNCSPGLTDQNPLVMDKPPGRLNPLVDMNAGADISKPAWIHDKKL